MFYLLAASRCDKGGEKPTRFEITDDGSLIYDGSKGRVCQIKSATNMDQPTGDYLVTWRCDTGEVKENLSTFMEYVQDGSRRCFLIRKGKLFEQCKEQDQ